MTFINTPHHSVIFHTMTVYWTSLYFILIPEITSTVTYPTLEPLFSTTAEVINLFYVESERLSV